jgi:hypothetical protein
MSTKNEKASRTALRRSADEIAAQAAETKAAETTVQVTTRADADAPAETAAAVAPIEPPILDTEIVFDETPLFRDTPELETAPVAPAAVDAFVIEAPASAQAVSEPGVEAPAAPPLMAAVPTPAATTANAMPAKRPVVMSKRATMMAIAAGCALMIGALALVRDQSSGASVAVNAAPASKPVDAAPQADAAPATSQPSEPLTEPAPVAPVATLATANVQAPKPLPKAVGAARLARAATSAPAPAVVAPVAAAPVPPPAPEPAATAVTSAITPAAIIETTLADGPAPVTITGCLEGTTDGTQFRLSDTDGDAAPKARGWKSGFLKKRPAAVSLSAPDTSALRKYVGHRVSATGVLASREMRVRSFQPTGAMCD